MRAGFTLRSEATRGLVATEAHPSQSRSPVRVVAKNIRWIKPATYGSGNIPLDKSDQPYLEAVTGLCIYPTGSLMALELEFKTRAPDDDHLATAAAISESDQVIRD
ncbi:hypothetical protein TNCV_2031001 [Trichonephila clavipes]|nr:hypothetical protein TNCV_2031001 [Trichonephila clavipes]